MTLWSPDTCGCRIRYEVSGDDVAHLETVEVCRKHSGKAGQDHLDAVLSHNRAKNQVLNLLVESGIAHDEIEVGYHPDADPADDPVKVKGRSAEVEAKITAALTNHRKAGTALPKIARTP